MDSIPLSILSRILLKGLCRIDACQSETRSYQIHHHIMTKWSTGATQYAALYTATVSRDRDETVPQNLVLDISTVAPKVVKFVFYE